jgi:formylglycine-generating enzyme required for sulfatase activity
MVGNVFERTEDCYHPNYQGAPASGSAWIAGGTCTDRILRGGAWYGDPRLLRSADRLWVSSVGRDNFAGFRVGRTLTP